MAYHPPPGARNGPHKSWEGQLRHPAPAASSDNSFKTELYEEEEDELEGSDSDADFASHSDAQKRSPARPVHVNGLIIVDNWKRPTVGRKSGPVAHPNDDETLDYRDEDGRWNSMLRRLYDFLRHSHVRHEDPADMCQACRKEADEPLEVRRAGKTYFGCVRALDEDGREKAGPCAQCSMRKRGCRWDWNGGVNGGDTEDVDSNLVGDTINRDQGIQRKEPTTSTKRKRDQPSGPGNGSDDGDDEHLSKRPAVHVTLRSVARGGMHQRPAGDEGDIVLVSSCLTYDDLAASFLAEFEALSYGRPADPKDNIDKEAEILMSKGLREKLIDILMGAYAVLRGRHRRNIGVARCDKCARPRTFPSKDAERGIPFFGCIQALDDQGLPVGPCMTCRFKEQGCSWDARDLARGSDEAKVRGCQLTVRETEVSVFGENTSTSKGKGKVKETLLGASRTDDVERSFSRALSLSREPGPSGARNSLLIDKADVAMDHIFEVLEGPASVQSTLGEVAPSPAASTSASVFDNAQEGQLTAHLARTCKVFRELEDCMQEIVGSIEPEPNNIEPETKNIPTQALLGNTDLWELVLRWKDIDQEYLRQRNPSVKKVVVKTWKWDRALWVLEAATDHMCACLEEFESTLSKTDRRKLAHVLFRLQRVSFSLKGGLPLAQALYGKDIGNSPE